MLVMAPHLPGASLFPMALWRDNARRLVDFVFPPLCGACAAPVAAAGQLCPACWGKLTFLENTVCACCGLPFPFDVGADALCGRCLAEPPAFDRVRAAVVYDDAARQVVLPYKHADRLDMTPQLADWLARAARLGDLQEPDVVAAVPLHRRRLWRRRYNQAALLALALGRTLERPVWPDLLRRARPTPPQGGLGRDARRLNVKGAFVVRDAYHEKIAGKSVLLVDDVMTTGATLDACAQALKKAGARRVTAVVIARAPGSD